jgi:hypothetical protein
MQKPPETFFNVEDFVPELREIFAQPPLDPRKTVFVAVPVKNPDEQGGKFIPDESARNLISLSDGKNVWDWKVDSLRALFRGNRQPPVLGDYPEAYNDSFMILDLHVLELSRVFGDRRDTEMKEVFSTLRRRPDGASRDFVHDYLWQAAALILGTRPLSQAEFEAIMARLERSARTFEQGPSSRNYVAALRSMFDRDDGD